MPARIITSVKDFETWESSIDGLIWLKKFDRRGDIIEERVKPHGKVLLTPEERRYNQEMIVEVANDPFQNGMLIPINLVETADDYEELRGNPNHLTEQDMRALLDNPKDLDGLEVSVANVSNPTTLQRLLAVAESEEVDATVKQVKIIRQRLAEIAVEPSYTEVETVIAPGGREVVQTTAPTSPAPRKKSVGRR